MALNIGTEEEIVGYLQKQMELLKFDQRLVNINLKRGNLSRDELQRHLDSISDSEKNATTMSLESVDDQYDSEESDQTNQNNQF